MCFVVVLRTMLLGMLAAMLVGCRANGGGDAAPPPATAPASAAVLSSSDVSPGYDRPVSGDKKARKKQRQAERGAVARGARGTYSGEPRTEDGRIDIVRLAGELEEIRANTYN